MFDSAHTRYHQRLSTLATGAVTPAVFSQAELCQANGFAQRHWVRTYGRFTPDQEPYATLCFVTADDPQALVRIEVFTTRPDTDERKTPLIGDATLGWLCLNVFPDDPQLPTLPAILANLEHVTIIRYRPLRRCTLRVEGVTGTRFVKVFPYADGQRLHREAVALWDVSQRGELGFRVAPPGHWDTSTHALWQYQAKGIPAAPGLFGPQGARIAHVMGRAAASLACSSAQPTEVFDVNVQFARSQRYAEEIVARVPQLAPAVTELLQTLATIHARVKAQPLRPIHGGLHAHQWLADGEDLALVDFDRFSRGDPELDVATFLGELDFEKRLHVPVAQLAHAFLTAYEATAGPLNRSLLAAYRAHKRLAKTLRTTRAIRPDGDQRAARHLHHAFDALQEVV